MIIVDVGSTVVSIIINAADGSTLDTVLASAMPVVETIRFAP